MSDTLSERQFMQYYRQILLPEVGEKGQQALLNQHILIVGIGGLGTHVAQQLAAAGIGHLYLLDDDKVEITNLPRQVLFNPTSVGREKVTCAANEITRLNPDVSVSTFCEKFDAMFAQDIFNTNPALKQAHENGKFMLLDCSDNMSTRQLVNAWCATQLIPSVSASVTAFSGQIMLIDGIKVPEAGCYHCVFSATHIQQNCNDMGVLGPTVGIIASMQTLTTIRHVLDINESTNHLHIFDGLSLTWRKIVRHRDLNCTACQHWHTLPNEQALPQNNLDIKEAYL